MYANDFLLSFFLMTILFLRQISILKDYNKINYAPLMLAIGIISSLIHFIIHPDTQDLILLLRESFLPLLVALFLYIIMNIMHQTRMSENSKAHDEYSRVMVDQVTQLKEFMSDLENRMNECQLKDRQTQKDLRLQFINDIKALDTIQLNQDVFIKKFEDIEQWHQSISKEFDSSSAIQMLRLDTIIHEYIDILKTSEHDHYNKIKNILEETGNSRDEIVQDINKVKKNLLGMNNIATEIAKAITKNTLSQLSGVTKSFEGEIVSLESHSKGIRRSLVESESTLSTIREKSEMIMNQMVLSANKMNELQEKNTGLQDVYTMIKELMQEMEAIKADYVKSQAQLSIISSELQSSENEQIDTMKHQIEILGVNLTKGIEESLSKLHEHYHIAEDNITQSVQILAKKAQQQKGYKDVVS